MNKPSQQAVRLRRVSRQAWGLYPDPPEVRFVWYIFRFQVGGIFRTLFGCNLPLLVYLQVQRTKNCCKAEIEDLCAKVFMLGLRTGGPQAFMVVCTDHITVC